MRSNLRRPLLWLLAAPILASQTATAAPTKGAASSRAKTGDADPKLQALRKRLFTAETDVAKLERRFGEFTVFSIFGKYESGDAREVTLYARAIGEGPSPFGASTDEKFLTVIAPYPQDLKQGRFDGRYRFIETRRGRNIYGRPPAEYFQVRDALVTRRAQRDQLAQEVESRLAELRGVQMQREKAAAAVVAQRRAEQARIEAERLAGLERQRKATLAADVEKFLTTYTAEEATAAGTPAFHERFATEAMKYYKRLLPRDDVAILRETYAAQVTRLATLQAQSGDLLLAAETASKALWLNAAGVPLEGASAAYARQDFEATAGAVFARQPGLLDALLKAWAAALPDYVQRVPYVEQMKARKFSEVLMRCSGSQAGVEQDTIATAYRITFKSDSNATADTAATTTGGATAGIVAPPVARPAALNFHFISTRTGRIQQLSDHRGKVVVFNYYHNADIDAVQPTPTERLYAFSKDYDADKVVFMNYVGGNNRDTTFSIAINRVKNSHRYPPEFFTGPFKQEWNGPGPTYAEISKFYGGTWRDHSRDRQVIVIDPQGNVVGRVPFVYNTVLSQRSREVFDFDQDKLDALIIEALSP